MLSFGSSGVAVAFLPSPVCRLGPLALGLRRHRVGVGQSHLQLERRPPRQIANSSVVVNVAWSLDLRPRVCGRQFLFDGREARSYDVVREGGSSYMMLDYLAIH